MMNPSSNVEQAITDDSIIRTPYELETVLRMRLNLAEMEDGVTYRSRFSRVPRHVIPPYAILETIPPHANLETKEVPFKNTVNFIPDLTVCDKCDDIYECSICLNTDTDIPIYVKTSCNHIFCQTCIEKLKHSLSQPNDKCYVIVPCPMCRKNLYIE
jgi:hypothetical protein